MQSNSESKLAELPVVEIETTAGTQTRFGKLDRSTVDKYVCVFAGQSKFPPIVVFAEKGSKRYLLADGFHRVEAAKIAGAETILASILEGGVQEAKEYSLGANDDHGLHRTPADKRSAVSIALKDPKWCTWGNREIARMCNVSHTFVAKVREDGLFEGKKEKPRKAHATRAEDNAGGNVATCEPADPKPADLNRRAPRTQRQVNRDDTIQGANQFVTSWPDSIENLAEFDHYANVGLMQRVRNDADEYIHDAAGK